MSRMKPSRRPVTCEKRAITPDEHAKVKQILTHNGRGPDDLTLADGGGGSTGNMHVVVRRDGEYAATIVVGGWNDDWLSDFEEQLKAGAYD